MDSSEEDMRTFVIALELLHPYTRKVHLTQRIFRAPITCETRFWESQVMHAFTATDDWKDMRRFGWKIINNHVLSMDTELSGRGSYGQQDWAEFP